MSAIQNATTAPRALIREEAQKAFLDQIRVQIGDLAYAAGMTEKEKLKSLAFGICCVLDGVKPGIPRFCVVPSPANGDAEDAREQGDNWFPEAASDIAACVDIAGDLHEKL